MGIIYKNNGKHNRDIAKEYLKKQKELDPNYRVLDIGGAANPWCNELVDAYVDLLPIEGKKVYTGDIYSEELWEQFKKDKYNFCICTHTLEDLRDPMFIINKINKYFDAGFISVPNKHTELSNIECSEYLGYCHHRWIFTIVNDELKTIAKMPIVQIFNTITQKEDEFDENKAVSILSKLFNKKSLEVNSCNNKKNIAFSPLNWVNKNIIGNEFELAFLFEDNFNFSFINGDFAGQNRDELINLYINNLKDGL